MNKMNERECNSMGGDWEAGICKYGGHRRSSSKPLFSNKKRQPWLQLVIMLLLWGLALYLAWQLSKSLAILVAPIVTLLGILYVISPIDFIPDVVPGVGWLDDVLVVILVILSWVFKPITSWILFGFILFFGWKMYVKVKGKL